MRNLRAFLRLPVATQAKALETALALLLARLLVEHVPMRYWRRYLNTATGTGEGRGASGRLCVARSVCRIVRKVARRLPFRARCLPQAMAAQWMLRRRGIRSRLVFGARRDKTAARTLDSHAWLIAAGECVIGGEDIGTYFPLSRPDDAALQR